MAQQSTTVEKASAPTKKKQLQGKRALLWIPEKVESGVRVEKRSVQPAPVGSNQIRPMTFAWFDREETEARHNRHETDSLIGKPQATANAQPVIKSLSLIPGCNWVDLELWEKMCASETPGVRIKSCLLEGSIVEPEINPSVNILTGSIDDYSDASAMEIINGTNDIDELEAYLKTGAHRPLIELIKGRIDLVQTRLAAVN
jgi:hypothetical protein